MFALQNKTFNTRVMQKAIIFIFAVFFLISCGGRQKVQEEDVDTKKMQAKPQTVEVQVIGRSNFNRQLFSNGILHAARKAELRFRTSGVLKRLNAVNGQRVKAGSIIASLENKKQKLALDQAKDAIEAAFLELNSQLIMHGGKQGDTTSVSRQMLQSLKIQSGYNRALNQLKQSRLEYENTFLRAPFTGIVSGLEAQTYNMISGSKVFCNLIDNSGYGVEFPVLESEIGRVHKGMEVSVAPFAGDTLTLKGKVTEINPEVDKNGLIMIKAVLKDTEIQKASLYDGMNVRVVIENTIPGQLTIPKEALVLRSNRKVVFTYENGLAKWNYVKTSFENSTQYVVTEGLNPGDTVIVKGNLNLAHDAKVVTSP